jgi:hypothetical protein
LTTSSVPNSLVQIYDAVAVDTIPLGAEVVFYYDMPDTYAAVKARFPNATLLGITTQGAHGPEWRMCDMETGDLTPSEAAQWAYDEITSGRPAWNPPTIYAQAANGQEVQQAVEALGLQFGTQVPWFMAWWNGVPDLTPPPPPWPPLPTPVGHQYYRESPDTYDMSVALPSWVYPAPPPPPPTHYQGEGMFIRNPGPGNASGPNGINAVAEGAICYCDSAGAVNLGNDWPAVVEAFGNANVPLVLVNSQPLLERFLAIALHSYAVD